jgi:hypothetical protein
MIIGKTWPRPLRVLLAYLAFLLPAIAWCWWKLQWAKDPDDLVALALCVVLPIAIIAMLMHVMAVLCPSRTIRIAIGVGAACGFASLVGLDVQIQTDPDSEVAIGYMLAPYAFAFFAFAGFVVSSLSLILYRLVRRRYWKDDPLSSEKSAPVLLPTSLLLHPLMLFLTGAIFGYASFVLAIVRIRWDIASVTEHDILLANYLGFIFPPLVGMWAGGIRRSWPWTVWGAVVGLTIGEIYCLVCGDNSTAVTLEFPCLLSGVAAVALGSPKPGWLGGRPVRFVKGLIAGLVLGGVYMATLRILPTHAFLLETAEDHHIMMSNNGPIAMGLASGLYMILFVWSTNLKEAVLKAT